MIASQGPDARIEAVLFAETRSGIVRAGSFVDVSASPDGGTSEVMRLLADAVLKPVGAAKPGVPTLPALIQVSDPSLVSPVAQIFGPLGVSVEYVPSVPAAEEALDALVEHFTQSGNIGTQLAPFAADVDPALITALYAEAAALWRRAPWSIMPDFPPIYVRVGELGPEPGVEAFYACVLGGAGIVTAIVLYYSAESLRRALETGIENPEDLAEGISDETLDAMLEELTAVGLPTEGMTREDLRETVAASLAEAFPVSGTSPEDDLLATEDDEDDEDDEERDERTLVALYGARADQEPLYLKWLKEHKINVPARDGVPRFMRTDGIEELFIPNARETRAMVTALAALNQFFAKFATRLRTELQATGLMGSEVSLKSGEPLIYLARVGEGAEATAVEVRYPPPGDDWLPTSDENQLGPF